MRLAPAVTRDGTRRCLVFGVWVLALKPLSHLTYDARQV
ncbi:hypothetical protein GGR60_003510 [Xanthomonas arboricola]|nr:hypothetical protein [Xanthomonas euroxanthea]